MEMRLLKKIYGAEALVPEDKRLGSLPSTKSTYSQLFRMAGPSMAEMVLTSLIGSIDTMMVGTLGSTAIAAVGLVGQPRMILLAVILAINAGLTAVVSRRKGQGRKEDAGATLRVTLLLVLLISGILALTGYLIRFPMMRLAGANEDTMEISAQYFAILMLGFPLNAMTLSINAAQRGTGNTRITMYTNLAANGINVLFNYMLIGGHLGCPALGVAGAAIATDLGILTGFVLAVIMARKKDGYLDLRFKKGDFLHPWEYLRPVVKVGSNALLEQLCMRVGFLVFARMVADLGTQAFAAHQVCMQFLNLTFCAADGIGVAGSALVGLNMGRKRPDISVLFGKAGQRVAVSLAIVIAIAVAIFKYPLVRLFTDEAEVIRMSEQVMYVVALFQPFQMSAVLIMGCLRGAGDTKFAARIMLLCITIIRPVTCALAIYVFHWGLVGAWLSSLIEMLFRMSLSYFRFSGGKWMKIEV